MWWNENEVERNTRWIEMRDRTKTRGNENEGKHPLATVDAPLGLGGGENVFRGEVRIIVFS
ncbi:hypothetical protein A3850_017140 [Lewinella sp. 4G2]|nr:hypothetical protein A3850_017140 [Lewinella sp. 4G2]